MRKGILSTAAENRIDGTQILHVDTVADVIAAINYAEGNFDGDGNPYNDWYVNPDAMGLALGPHRASLGAMKAAIAQGLENLSFYNSLRLVPPALDALIADPEIRLDGFLLPDDILLTDACLSLGRRLAETAARLL